MRVSNLLTAVLLVLLLAACAAGDPVEEGRAHLEAGEYTEAIADLEAVVEQDPDDSQGHFLLGQAYSRAEEPQKAADEFRTVLALDPDNGAAHHNLGVTYLQLANSSADFAGFKNLVKSAIIELQAAAELEPENADTHYQLGAAYVLQALPENSIDQPDPQALETAVAEFETALELEEGMPEALVGLGNAHIWLGDYAAAIEVLQQALDGAPELSEAHCALGEALAGSGVTGDACESYGRCRELNPSPTVQRQIEQVMAGLGCP